MIRFLLFTCFLFLITTLKAQFLKPSVESIRPALEKVVQAFPEEFKPIRGVAVPADPGTIQFLSTVEVPQSLETKIVGYSGPSTHYWLWESKLLATEDFAELKKIYRQYFKDISGGVLKIVDRRYISKEKYIEPTEELRLWVNEFRLANAVDNNNSLTIDLVAQFIFPEWVIFLRVYDKNQLSKDASDY